MFCRSTRTALQTTDQPLAIFDSGSKTGWIYSYYLQDEWKIVPTLTLNFGARFDQIAEFVSERQLSPRVNVVWQPTRCDDISRPAIRAISLRRRSS